MTSMNRSVLSRTGLAGFVVSVAALALLVAGCGGTSITPPTATGGSTSERAALAQRVLDRWSRAVDGHESAVADEVAHGPAVTTVRAGITNAAAVGVKGFTARYVDEDLGGLDAAETSTYGRSAWVGTVQLHYRSALDSVATRMEVSVVFVPDGSGARIAGVGGHDQRVPLWLLGPVDVRRAGDAAVVNAGDGDTAHYLALAQRALTDVRRVWGRWQGPLVLEVPASEEQLQTVLGADAGTYDNIAGVTTTVTGATVRGNPVHVFLNPAVFDTLRAKGAQVVVSHEATHVATGATFSQMPVWLLEGFADYVALDHAGVPVQTAAAQILARIRKHGAPKSLPTPAQLDPRAGGLGATYELAWLACRSIAAHHGEAALIRFYRAVDAGADVAKAFRSELGTSEGDFVGRWRSELTALAGT